MPRRTIDDVISRLDDIVERFYDRGSRLGFFPAMYRKTTIEVKKGLEAGRFEDPDRLEHLDVVFADRYFEAVERHERGETPTEAWAYAFQMGASAHPSVVQHLLLGMNAHINLDLGISAAEISAGGDLPALRSDFDTVNDILGDLIDRMQEDVCTVFPAFRALDMLGGELDERVVHFSIMKARTGAWHKAQRLAGLPAGADYTPHIHEFDRETARFARVICPPVGFSVLAAVQPDSVERRRVRRIIEALTD